MPGSLCQLAEGCRSFSDSTVYFAVKGDTLEETVDPG